MIVVTAPSGDVGSLLLPRLLEAGERVRVIVRDPTKLPRDIQMTLRFLIAHSRVYGFRQWCEDVLKAALTR